MKSEKLSSQPQVQPLGPAAGSAGGTSGSCIKVKVWIFMDQSIPRSLQEMQQYPIVHTGSASPFVLLAGWSSRTTCSLLTIERCTLGKWGEFKLKYHESDSHLSHYKNEFPDYKTVNVKMDSQWLKYCWCYEQPQQPGYVPQAPPMLRKKKTTLLCLCPEGHLTQPAFRALPVTEAQIAGFVFLFIVFLNKSRKKERCASDRCFRGC